MKKYIFYIAAVTFFSIISMPAFSNNGDKKKDKQKIQVRENLEKLKKDPKTIERAAKADVYIVKKAQAKKISN